MACSSTHLPHYVGEHGADGQAERRRTRVVQVDAPGHGADLVLLVLDQPRRVSRFV